MSCHAPAAQGLPLRQGPLKADRAASFALILQLSGANSCSDAVVIPASVLNIINRSQTHIYSSELQNPSVSYSYSVLLFTDEEINITGGYMIKPWSHSQKVSPPGLEPRSLRLKILCFQPLHYTAFLRRYKIHILQHLGWE